MKNILISLFLLLLNQNCDSGKSKGNSQKCIQYFDIPAYQKEGIMIDSVSINDTVPYLMQLSQFKSVFGQPDSSVLMPKTSIVSNLIPKDIQGDYFYHFIGRSVFVSKGQFIYPINIDFRSTPIEIKYKNILFRRDKIVETLRYLFPNSVKIYKGINSNAFRGTIIINGDTNNYDDNLWFFIIGGDQLIRLSMYSIPTININDRNIDED